MERFRFLRGDPLALSEQEPPRGRVGERFITSVEPEVMVVQLWAKPRHGESTRQPTGRVHDRQFAALLKIPRRLFPGGLAPKVMCGPEMFTSDVKELKRKHARAHTFSKVLTQC